VSRRLMIASNRTSCVFSHFVYLFLSVIVAAMA
jgi:hypothetical protein